MKQYSVRFECDECVEIYSTSAAADKCCHTGDHAEVYQCESCKTSHYVKEFAIRCCTNRSPEPVERLREHSIVRTPAPTARIVRPPQPGCEYCGIAQECGTVISCRCMK